MILGIDPGIRKLGYALIKSDLSIIDSGILFLDQKSPTRIDQFERIKKIYDFFEQLIKKYKIKIVGIEKLFFTKFNQSNAEFVYGVRGALIMLFLKNGMKIKEFAPIQLKKFVTGNAKAEKKLVQNCVMKLYGLVNFPEFADAADALALAYIANKLN
ncbi:MAG: crossover junction endodeoxyribonuclease RuvC [Candidatus Absconditabacterales bacterium]